MWVQIQIECDGAAFENDASSELAQILRGYAFALDMMRDDRHLGELATLRDSNGNTCGKIAVFNDNGVS
jgi:hypothetical protein